MAMPGHAVVDHMACGDLKSSEQGCSAVSLVVVSHGAGTALLER